MTESQNDKMRSNSNPDSEAGKARRKKPDKFPAQDNGSVSSAIVGSVVFEHDSRKKTRKQGICKTNISGNLQNQHFKQLDEIWRFSFYREWQGSISEFTVDRS